MKVLYPSWRAVLAVCLAAPWLWLISFAALAVSATLQLGRLPRYGNPDPKTVPEIALLHDSTWILLALTVLAPLVIGAYAALCLARGWRIGLSGRWLIAHLVGFALAVMTYFGDPLGLTDWFLD